MQVIIKTVQPIEGNVPLEILWTAIPAIIVLGISVYSFEVYNDIGGFDPHAIHEAPMTQEAMKMPGSAIAATFNDTSAHTLVKSESVNPSSPAQMALGLSSENEGQPPALSGYSGSSVCLDVYLSRNWGDNGGTTRSYRTGSAN